ncbi:MAG TPA: hypothetical protein VE397_20230, partial [Stellaceae bacterium]|nr:hypothetical protein [Stellaceae bacterium]
MAQVFPLTAPEGAVDEAEGALVATLAALPEEWILLRQRRIGDAAPAAVLVHPGIGVALVDLAPDPLAAGQPALRARLEQEGFGRFFPGELSIVTVAVAAEEIDAVGERLEAAFGAAPRLAIDDPDWADAVVELLLQPEDVAMAPVGEIADAGPNPHAVPPPYAEPVPAPPPPRAQPEPEPPPRAAELNWREQAPEPPPRAAELNWREQAP